MQDLVIALKADGGHLYEQIYDHIKNEIRKGELLCRERLPSTRSLAAYLQISRATVELAYEQLLAEGYIEAVPCKGYYVAQVEELYRMDQLQEAKPAAALQKKQQYVVDFSPNAIDMERFPFGIWRRISKNVLSQDKKETFLLGESQGDLALRETIARYLHASRGVNCTPEQIIVGAGNDYLLLLLRDILPGKLCIAFENPTYPRAYQILGLFAGQLVTVPSDESGVRVDGLAQANADVVYVMPSHQYPRGIVMPIGRRLELLRWAACKEGRYVIEDDYDSEFRYKGKPIPSLQASDKAGKVIYIGTFSKSIAPAIRISFMVLPKQLLPRYEKCARIFSSTVSRIDQAILDEFIRSGAFERHLNRMRKHYREKHEILLEGLRDFQGDFTISGENAGLHLLLTDKRGRSEELLKAAALERGVRVYGLSEALVGEAVQRQSLCPEKMETGQKGAAGTGLRTGKDEAEGRIVPATVLLGFGGLSTEQIRDGLARLRQAWQL